jgi:hypothetical protein
MKKELLKNLHTHIEETMIRTTFFPFGVQEKLLSKEVIGKCPNT